MKKAVLLLILMSTLNSYSTDNDTIKDNIRDRNSVSFSLTSSPSLGFGAKIFSFGAVSEFTASYFFIKNLSFNLTYSYGYQGNYHESTLTDYWNHHAISPSLRYYFGKKRNLHFDLAYYNGKYREWFLNSSIATKPININSAGIGFGYSHLIRKNLGSFNNKLEITAYYKQLIMLDKKTINNNLAIPAIFQIGVVYNL